MEKELLKIKAPESIENVEVETPLRTIVGVKRGNVEVKVNDFFAHFQPNNGNPSAELYFHSANGSLIKPDWANQPETIYALRIGNKKYNFNEEGEIIY
jgi:hypothetical protein